MKLQYESAYTWCALKLVYLLLWATVFSQAYGQNQSVSFQSLQEGLTSPHIKCIIKDSKGFMWFGTFNGLTRYDGNKFIHYEHNPSDSGSISHNAINAIIEGPDHNLFIGTGLGINIYNREKDNFSMIKAFGKREVFSVSTLFLDDEGILWVGTSGNGLFTYNPENSEIVNYQHQPDNKKSLASNFVNAIIEDNYGNMWVGTREGLDLLQGDGTFKHFTHHPKHYQTISSNSIKDLTLDKNGTLWIGTYGGGLNKLERNGSSFSFSHIQPTDHPEIINHNNILSLASDENGHLWVGTENGGLSFLNTQTLEFANYFTEDGRSGTLSNNSIWSLFYDDTDILWIGTSNSGINIYDKKFEKFKLLQSNPVERNTLVANNVRAFVEDKSHNLWIGTDGGGLSYYNPESQQFISKVDNSILSSKAIISMAMDSLDRLWVGTWAGGLELLDGQSGKKIKNYKIRNESGPVNNIMKVYFDKHGSLWAGTFGKGLFKYNWKTDQFVQIEDPTQKTHLTKTAYISSIHEDHENIIWVGTLFGLVSIKRNEEGAYSFQHFMPDSDQNSISSSKITYIFEDSRDDLWIGTEEGLNKFNRTDSTFTSFDTQDGLANNSVNGILEDDNHNLWITTNNGLSKFNPDQQSFYNFSKEDGLCSNVFNPGSCLKTSSGEFYLGGNNGINIFFPDSIKRNDYIPPVYITDLQLFNQSESSGDFPVNKNISEAKNIRLNYQQNSFTIEFAALNYTRPAKNQYVYMLEGFENTWNHSTNRNFVTYTNLDPGKYTFMVKGSNNDGVWNETPQILEITISPPLWGTPWAYITYFIILFLLLFSFIKLFRIKALQAQKLKMERMNHEKDEELNNLKIQFFTNVSHDLKTPLSLIISPLEEFIAEQKMKGEPVDRLNIALSNTEKMVRLVNELMDFTKSEGNRLKLMVREDNLVKFAHEIFYLYTDEANRKNIQYQFKASADRIITWFDKNKLEKIIHNLISNAFNHTSENGSITVKIGTGQEIGLQGNKLENMPLEENVYISVIDNGCGISPQYLDRVFDRFFQSPETDSISQTGTGIGLALTKNLVELHHGKISVTSKKWKETCFKVKLPLGKSHFKEDEIFPEKVDISKPSTNLDNNLKNGKPSRKDTSLVLVVEDNIELRHYIISVLSQNFRTIEASNGEEGFEMASSELPDLILSDIIMPKMNGLELCRKVKQDSSTSHIPVIFLTSKTTTYDQIEGVESGADSYITKPFNIKHLEATIYKIIETRKKLFKRYSQDIFILPKEISTNKSDQEFLERIVQYIDDNVMDAEITVENLASYLKMNRSNVYRKVKSLTGETATGFIRSVRLKMALKYIEEGEHNISEIAFKVGFESPWYFAKCFKKQFGKSPSEFLPAEKAK